MIPWARPKFFGLERDYVLDALESGWISGGPYVKRLEEEMAAKLGAKHALAVCNGTAALHLAFLGLGLGPGDEVIVPGYTFVAAVNMALCVGATPVFAEIDPRTWLLDPVSVAACLTERTKAIVPVHLYGNVADVEALKKLAAGRGIAVIEDAAEACFSRRDGRFAGTLGTVGTLSFHATKTLPVGEGGMVLTDDAVLAEKMFTIREHGMRARRSYWHDAVGHNFRLSNLHAALGCAQLAHIDDIIAQRGRVLATYRRLLEYEPRLRLQYFPDTVDPVLWMLCVQFLPAAGEGRRDRALEHLMASGIEVRPGFHAIGEMPIYRTQALPGCLTAAQTVLALPTYPELDDRTIKLICRCLLEALDL
jgi:perosamine synthetase